MLKKEICWKRDNIKLPWSYMEQTHILLNQRNQN